MTLESNRHDWDPMDPAVQQNPMAKHKELRGRCPVAHSEQFGGFWALTKYGDIEAAAKDTDTFVSTAQFAVPQPDVGVPWIPLQSDPPDHFRYRGIIQPFFARGRVKRFEPRIRELAASMIDGFLDDKHGDVAEHLSYPLPTAVLCMFLGLPEADWDRVKWWSNEIIRCANEADFAAFGITINDLFSYVARLKELRTADPLPVDEDIMSALLAADHDGERLSDEELRGYFTLLLTAGHETTSNAIGNALLHLAEHPEDQEKLRDNPDLIPTAVDETLRLYGPVQGLARTTTRDVEIGGTTIPQGDRVVLLWASAGRDEEVFENPDASVLDRSPNRHLAFGAGIHRCIGADLGRLEVRIAVEEFLARTRRFTLHAPYHRSAWPTVGIRTLPLAWDPA